MVDFPAFTLVRAYVLTQLYGDAVIPKHGVATYEFHLLYHLRGAAPTTQAELGRRLLRDPMNVSRLVRSLESRQLLRRTASAADSRAYHVALTAEGAALVERVLSALAEGDPLRGWSERDARTFSALLQRACQSLDEACVRAGIHPQRSQNPQRRKQEEGGHDDARRTSTADAARRRVGRPHAEEPVPRPAKRRRR